MAADRDLMRLTGLDDILARTGHALHISTRHRIDAALMAGVKNIRDFAGEIELWQPEDGLDELERKVAGIQEAATTCLDRVRRELPPKDGEPAAGQR